MLRYATTLLLALLLFGCASRPAVEPATAVPAEIAAARQQDYPGFSAALASALHNGDKQLFVQSLDMERFLQRSFADAGLTADEYAAIAGKSGQLARQLADNIDREVGEDGRVDFIRVRPQADTGLPGTRSLLRIVTDGDGVAYWDLYLDRQDGAVIIYDWFNYGTGQLASTSAGGFLKLLKSLEDDGRSRLLKQVNRYVSASRKQQYGRALELYNEFPAALQHDPLLQISRVQLAMQYDAAAYRAALDDLARYHGEDDRFALMLVDYYLLSGQYAQGHRALDRVSARTGGDAGLQALHAGLSLQAGDYPAAIGYARAGIELDADYEQNYWVLLEALANAGYYDDTVLVLQILEDGFYYEFDADELATVEGFEDFGRSPAFANWRASLQ